MNFWPTVMILRVVLRSGGWRSLLQTGFWICAGEDLLLLATHSGCPWIDSYLCPASCSLGAGPVDTACSKPPSIRVISSRAAEERAWQPHPFTHRFPSSTHPFPGVHPPCSHSSSPSTGKVWLTGNKNGRRRWFIFVKLSFVCNFYCTWSHEHIVKGHSRNLSSCGPFPEVSTWPLEGAHVVKGPEAWALLVLW